MELNKIHILAGESQYDIFSHWAERLQQGFVQLGVDAEVLAPAEELRREVGDDTVSIGFNRIRFWQEPSLSRRHFMWVVDHPSYVAGFFMPRLIDPSFAAQTIPLLVDRTRCAFASEQYKCGATAFLPHAATLTPEINMDGDRPLDAVFFGSIDDPEQVLTQLLLVAEKISPQCVDLFNNLLTSYPYASGCPLDIHMLQMFNRALGVCGHGLLHLFSSVFPYIERYLRTKHRIGFLRSIKRTKVHLYGAGPWDSVGLPENIEVHPPVSHSEMGAILCRSRVLLNHMSNFCDGSHERVFDALACGCGVITTPTDYLREQFKGEQGVVFCDAGMCKELDSMIATGVPGVATGRESVLREHTMQSRAETLLQMVAYYWGLTVPVQAIA